MEIRAAELESAACRVSLKNLGDHSRRCKLLWLMIELIETGALVQERGIEPICILDSELLVELLHCRFRQDAAAIGYSCPRSSRDTVPATHRTPDLRPSLWRAALIQMLRLLIPGPAGPNVTDRLLAPSIDPGHGRCSGLDTSFCRTEQKDGCSLALCEDSSRLG